MAFETLYFQAEDGIRPESNSTGTVVRNASNPESGGFTGLRPNFTGTGYVDFGSTAGDVVRFAFDDADGGTRTLDVRYGSNGPRPLDVVVNGESIGNPAFATTDPDGVGGVEGFSNWQYVTFEITTTPGANVVALQIPSPGANAPNVDAIAISEPGAEVSLLAPTIDSAPQFSVDENTTAVGQVVASDLDGNTLTFALSGADAGNVSIDDDGNLTLDAAPDFEVPGDADGDGVYAVTVEVSDGFETVTQDVNVAVGDVDETPATPFAQIAIQAETATITTTGGGTRTLTQTGLREGETSGNPATKDVFDLRPNYSGEGYLDFGSSTNGAEEAAYTFSSPVAGTFELHIRYASSGVRSARVSDGTSETDVSFASTGTTSGRNATAFDNWSIATIQVTLAEGENTITMSLFGGNGPNIDALAITAIGAAPDFAPRFTTRGEFTVVEGETAIGTIGAVDVDEDTTDADSAIDPVAFAITGGADASAFAIDAATGALSLNAPADLEAKADYQVVVAATDSAGNVTAQTVTVAVTDVDQPATALALDAQDVTENVPGAMLATIVIADADTTYGVADVTLSGPDAALFRVIEDGGLKLALAETEALDFEAPAQPSVTITVGGLSQEFTPAPQNDAGDDVADDAAPTAGAGTAVTDEDTAVDIPLADLIDDVEDGEPTIASATSADGEVTVDGTTLTFTPAADFNGEAAIDYVVEDTAGQQAASTVTVTVDPVNDVPQLSGSVADASVSVDEGGTVSLADLVTIDVDGDAALVLRQSDGGPAPEGVLIDGDQVVISAGLDLGTLDLVVVAADSESESAPIGFSVTIEAAAAAPFETIVLQGEAFTLDTVGEQAGNPNLIRTRTENPEKKGIFNPGGDPPSTNDAPDFDDYGLRKGYSGDGYLDPNGNDTGAQASITFDVPAGTYDVVVRYSNGNASQERPITVSIDGASASIDDTRTGNFATWETSIVTLTVTSGGGHTLVLSQDATNNAPNIDAVAIAAQGQGGLVVFDQAPEARPGAVASTAEATAVQIDLSAFVADKEDDAPVISA